jgi:mediator of RNA polymerase II transcription subunit 12
VLAPLFSRLISLLSKLLTLSPPSFVSPTTWFKCREALRAGLPQDDDERHRIYRMVDARNEQLVASCNKTPPAARQTLVRLLDMTLQTPMSDDLPSKCWDLSQDKATLVRIVLDWCTSVYRPGVAKVYVSWRVLRDWSTRGVDVTASLLDYIALDPLEQAERRSALYHLACELTRSGHLSVPRYAQWLIARGGIMAQEDVDPDGRCCTRLLVELPVHALSESERNHRAGILRRASYSVDQERADHEMAISYIKQTLGMPHDSTGGPLLSRKPLPLGKLARRIRMSSFALKADVGSWLQASLVAGADADQATNNGNQALQMSQTAFNAIRTILESARDFSTLASVLKPISKVSDCEILASCADTASRHVLTFAALDVAQDLFDTFYRRLRVIATEQGIGARPLLASLACLATRMPGMQAMAAQLTRDLAQTDRNNPVDACSPVSDNMGVLDDAANLHEEIEKHLANGTVLERQTMNNFFQLAMKLLNSSWNQTFELQRAYALLLARIRGFDAKHFDSLMMNWTCYVRSTTNRVSILQMFPLLISVGCLSLPLLLASTQAEQPANTGAGAPRAPVSSSGAGNAPHVVQITWRSRYSQEVLDLVMKPHTSTGLLSQDECYRLAILQDQALRENATEIIALVRQALIEYSFCRNQGDVEGLPLDQAESRTCLVTMLRSLVLRDANGVIKALSIRSSDAHLGRWIDRIATELLVPDHDPGTQVTFDQVFELTNDFTLPFCQLKLALSLSLADQNNADTADRMQLHLELFAKAMDNAIDAKNISWTGMLSSLSPEITHQLKSRAQTRFLNLLPSPKSQESSDRIPEQDLQMANNLLTVMDAIIRGGSMGRPPQLVGAMTDKLADLWEILCSQSAGPASKSAVLQHWLPSILSFITLHTSTFDSSKEGFAIRAKTVIILAGIIQAIASLPPTIDVNTQPSPRPYTTHPSTPSIQNRLFDLACLLADSLSDEVRSQCIRLVPCSALTTQLKYILSHPRSPPTENIMLCVRDKPPPPPTTARAAQGFPAAALLGTPLSLWGGGLVAGGSASGEKLTPFVVRRWEMLNEPTPNVGENDTAVALGMFEARKV